MLLILSVRITLLNDEGKFIRPNSNPEKATTIKQARYTLQSLQETPFPLLNGASGGITLLLLSTTDLPSPT
jgi:hypothetical protein